MKIYDVSVENDIHYASDGGVAWEFSILAHDMTEAFMEADEVRQLLVEALREQKISDFICRDLRVCSVKEQGDVFGRVSEVRFRGGGIDEERQNGLRESCRKLAGLIKKTVVE